MRILSSRMAVDVFEDFYRVCYYFFKWLCADMVSWLMCSVEMWGLVSWFLCEEVVTMGLYFWSCTRCLKKGVLSIFDWSSTTCLAVRSLRTSHMGMSSSSVECMVTVRYL